MFRKILIESALATALVFAITFALSSIPLNFSALQPLENAIEGFDVMDMYYSQLKATEGNFSKEVIVVNIQDADRAEIAELIDIVAFGEPKVIGVDVLFANQNNQFKDSLLAHAVSTNSKVILGSYYDQELQSIVESYPDFQGENHGFTNFVGADSRYSTIRYFTPELEIDDKNELAFSVQVAAYADQEAVNQFLERSNQTEAINYIGNLETFLIFEKDEIVNFEIDPDVFQDKVVLLGYLGATKDDANNIEDKLYTPLNSKMNGHSAPDMSGVLIHANIVEMILSRSWINAMGQKLKWALTIFGTYVHVALFMFLMVKWDLYFDAWSRLLQILSTIAILYAVFSAYHYLNYRIYIAPLLVSVALAVDTLFIYEAVVNTIYKRFKKKSVLIQ